MRECRRLGRWLFDRIPSNSRTLSRICQRYVDRYNGDNNSDPSRNGEEAFLRSELPRLRGAVVFDVGANVGNWARLVHAINPSLELHCFEPSRASYRQLAAREWAANVTVANKGLSDHEGNAELYVVEPASGLNSLHARRGVEACGPTARESVSLTTGDGYCGQHGIDQIALLKVDVEGHELSVFRGMQRMLGEGRVQVIQFEYGGCNLDARVYLADIWDYLAPLGFRFSKLFPEGARAIAAYSQALETFRYSNWVARLTSARGVTGVRRG